MPTISKMLYMDTSQDDNSKEENDILKKRYMYE